MLLIDKNQDNSIFQLFLKKIPNDIKAYNNYLCLEFNTIITIEIQDVKPPFDNMRIPSKISLK